ncbi:hypothetical protein [Massilia sp. H6]|uniref:hypothetical protein n=1 Tax=Massilia sp. H6 TaxID=2970464 RepID=UPI0021698A4B|nr:hypothetical protein [Massilia sp. H6]UVW28865.1 hypothetical protein NRS07_01560 [Massilia sp. H6]
MKETQLPSMELLNQEDIDNVSGGIIFAPVVYTAFVSGAKWGAGLGLAALAIKGRFS